MPCSSRTKNVPVESVLQVCEQRVSAAVTPGDLEQHDISGQELAGRIAEILSRNLASGRAQRVMGAGGQGGSGAREPKSRGETSSPPWHPCTLAQIEAYVDRVIAGYLWEGRRVERLAARDGTEWTRMCDRLAVRACNMLLRLGLPTARAASEAADFAQQACERIFRYPFPYDVSFDAWATLILRNRILQRHTRSPDLMDRRAMVRSLDQSDRSGTEGDSSLHDLLADQSSDSAFERAEVQARLVEAIAHLPSQEQQQVIIYTFFDELSDEEIARRLGRTRQAVYNLRHRALVGLKQILEG